MSYYALVSRPAGTSAKDADWEVQFGDYDRSCVAYEMAEMKQHDRNMAISPRPTYKIIKLNSAHGYALDRAVASLNANRVAIEARTMAD